jgi:hypothetical protein
MNCELQHKLCEFFFMQPPWMFIWPSISHDLLGIMQVAQSQWVFFTRPLLSYVICASCMFFAFFSSSLLHTTPNMQIVCLFIFFLVGNWRGSLNMSSNSSCDHVNWARDAMIFKKATSMSMSNNLTGCIVFLQWCNKWEMCCPLWARNFQIHQQPWFRRGSLMGCLRDALRDVLRTHCVA